MYRNSLGIDTELTELSPEQRYLGRPSLTDLFEDVDPKDKQNRDKVIATTYLQHGYYMKEIADYLGIHYRTVSYAVSEYEEI